MKLLLICSGVKEYEEICRGLPASVDVTWTATPAGFEVALEKGEYGAALISLAAQCEFIQQAISGFSARFPQAPVLGFIAGADVHAAVHGVKMGVDDVLAAHELPDLEALIQSCACERWQGAAVNTAKGGESQNLNFAQLAENAHQVFIVMDLQIGKIVYLNPSYEKVWGRSRQSFFENHQTFWDAIYPEDRTLLKEVQDHFSDGLSRTVDFRILRPDGELRWIEARTLFIRGAEGHHTHVAGIMADITERKETETELRTSKERYRLILETQSELIVRCLPDATLIYVNEAYCRYFGLDREKAIGSKFTPLIPPEDHDFVIGQMNSLTPATPIATYRHRVYNAKGEIRWQQWTDQAIFDEDQNLIEIQSAGSDITEQVQAQEMLRASEEKYRQMVEGIRDVLFEVDLEGNICYISPSVEYLSGYSPEEVTGRPFAQYAYLDDLPSIFEVLESAFRGKIRPLEFRVVKKNGEILWVRGMTQPIMKDGELAGARGLLTNIQERVMAEQSLRKFSRRLQILREVDQAILAAQSPQDIAQAVLEHVGDIIAYDSANVILFDLDAREFAIIAVQGLRGNLRPGTRKPLDQFASMDSLRQGKPFIIDDLGCISPSNFREEFMVQQGLNSYAGFPLIADGVLIGSLAMMFKNKNVINAEIVEVIRPVADSIAIAIRQAHLMERAMQRAQEMETLMGISSALRQVETCKEMYKILADQLSIALPVEFAMIFSLAGDSLVLTGVGGACSSQLDQVLMPENKLVWQTIHRGEISYVSFADIKDLGALCKDFTPDPSAIMAIVPVRTAWKSIGVMVLGFPAKREPAGGEKRLIEAVAEIAGNSLDRASMLETLETRVNNRTRELTTLYDVTVLATELVDLNTIFAQSLKHVLFAMNAEAGCILACQEEDDDENFLRLAAHQGFSEADVALINELFLKDGNLADLEVMMIPDLSQSELSLKGFHQAGFHSYLGAPMRSKGRTLGLLSVFRTTPQHFSVEEVALLAAIADQLGTAIESAALRTQAERTAVVEERQRLARELHDSVTQSLYSQSLFAQAGQDYLEQNDLEGVKESLQGIEESGLQAIKEMRLLLSELRPSIVENMGLAEALRSRLETVEKRAGIQTEFVFEGRIDLPKTVEAELYRVAIEALNNALKHAGADRVIVSLVKKGGLLKLQVSDNGKGFNITEIQPGGLGLKNMADRVEHIGGRLSIRSKPDQGTEVSITIPCKIEVK